jgi:uncharacterized protein (TIGR02246 family)
VSERIALIDAMMERYNARDADGYADFFVEDGAEAMYRGDVVRDGREGIRSGMAAVFEQFPENRAEVLEKYALGEFVVLSERVYRSPATDPFDVMTIYSFRGDRVERVEFVR